MIKLTQENLIKILEKKELEPTIQEETNQIYVALKISGKEFPLFLRIFEGGELCQLLVFFPANIEAGATPEVARLLHLLNKELDVPGFGMDENAKVVFYRSMIPVFNNEFQEQLLEAYINTIKLVCETFTGVILTVAVGKATFDEVIKKTKDHG